jgi:Cytochrome P450
MTTASSCPKRECNSPHRVVNIANICQLKWALVELARRSDVQAKMREEMSQFSAADPTWDQLTTSLPYLDAVVHEILRLHPAVSQIDRIVSIMNSS